MHALKKTFLLIVPFLALTISCLNDSSNENRALINVYLIDAPGDFDQVWLEIQGVEVFSQSGNSSSSQEWIPMDYIPLSNNVNVSSLIANSQLILGRTEVPLGNITQIKLIFGTNHFLVNDEVQIPLEFSSAEQLETIIDVNYNLEGAKSYDIFLDINLAKSIKTDPANTENFIFDPVIRSFTTDAMAEITGRVSPVDAQPFIHAILGEDTVSTLTNSSGNFSFKGLQAGEYKIYIQPVETYKDSLTNVTTKIDSLSEMETILLSKIGE